MFEHLAVFRIVIVTGPARSGTTICGHMIAADTGKRYFDDVADMIIVQRLRRMVGEQQNAVLQCPLLSWYADEFGGLDDVAVVMMRRAVAEIKASNDRLKECGQGRLDSWRDGYHRLYYAPGKHFSEAIYEHWDTVQRERIRHAFDVDYTSLAGHPLWVPEEQRRTKSWRTKSWRTA